MDRRRHRPDAAVRTRHQSAVPAPAPARRRSICAQVTLHAPPNEKLGPDDTFKFMLSFDHDKVLLQRLVRCTRLTSLQFLTPWIIISDRKARLVLCKITFKYAVHSHAPLTLM